VVWKTESKVGSLKNASYSPGGGNLKVCWIFAYFCFHGDIFVSLL